MKKIKYKEDDVINPNGLNKISIISDSEEPIKKDFTQPF
jgi:hypothetical protein